MLREIRNQNSSKQNNTQDRFFNAKTLTKERDKEDLGSGCLLKRGFISLIHSITLLKVSFIFYEDPIFMLKFMAFFPVIGFLSMILCFFVVKMRTEFSVVTGFC